MNEKRPNKGASLLDFPDNYIVLDLETTGLSPDDNEIIEIGALKICNNEISDTFQRLVKPSKPISQTISDITGITNDMLATADDLHCILPDFDNFVQGNIIVGHNINFDINFIYDCYPGILGKKIPNDYVDTLRISRRLLPELPHHKLNDVSQYFDIHLDDFHRALNDCYYTYACYCKLKELAALPEGRKLLKQPSRHTHHHSDNNPSLVHVESNAIAELKGILQGIMIDDVITDAEVINLSIWLDQHSALSDNSFYRTLSDCIRSVLADGVIDDDEREYLMSFFNSCLDGSSNVCENVVCFADRCFCLSGNFETGSKTQIGNCIAANGGTVVNSVTKKLNYLVVGNCCSSAWKYGNYGTKVEKAKELIGKGVDIKIISESDLHFTIL